MKKVLGLSLIFLAATASAQEIKKDSLQVNELEAITIVGDKSKSIPGSGQYISNIKLQESNQPNINNVLRLIPGVNIRDEEGFGLRPNIGFSKPITNNMRNRRTNI